MDLVRDLGDELLAGPPTERSGETLLMARTRPSISASTWGRSGHSHRSDPIGARPLPMVASALPGGCSPVRGHGLDPPSRVRGRPSMGGGVGFQGLCADMRLRS